MRQVDSSDIVRTLFMKGIMLSMNQQLDKNTVKLVAKVGPKEGLEGDLSMNQQLAKPQQAGREATGGKLVAALWESS